MRKEEYMPGSQVKLSREVITSIWEKLLQPGVWSMEREELKQYLQGASSIDQFEYNLNRKANSVGLYLNKYMVTYIGGDIRHYWELIPKHESEAD
jgi:hypothetical protein